jgi:hypothetical protein
MSNKPTKPAQILRLIRRQTGASMAQLQKATNWQPHSIRAALSGLRKSGHQIERAKNDKDITHYRIAKEAS